MTDASPAQAAKAEDLRQRAERRLAQLPAAGDVSAAQALQLLHELQVHQIELQMQNEALVQSEQAAREARDQLARLHATLEQQVADRTAELVQAREAADAASQAKGALLATMSHELRTPLNGVQGMIGLALSLAQDSRQIDWLNKASRSAAHLLGVINNVLDLSKIEAERMQLAHLPLQLQEVLDLLTSLLSQQAQQKALALEVELAPELGQRRLWGDSLRLGQVLLNLVGNAIKFTEQGRVRVVVQRVSEGPRQLVLRFEVTDTGLGISPPDLPRLFKPFEQVDASAARRLGGTGLGLVISQRLVHLMAGQIGVNSQPGLGSTFWFTVCLDTCGEPACHQPTLSAQEAKALLERDHAGARVLLVDDNPVNQEILCALLTNAQLQVVVADDGATALAQAQALAPDLILMDLHMPVMDGLTATRAMRQWPALASTPVIALTASALEQDRQQCLAAGMDDHLCKPVEPAALYNGLLRWLTQGAGRPG